MIFCNDRYPASVNNQGKLKTNKDWKLEKVIIEDNVSIGSGSVIMCGVKIGKGSVIGANSLVLKNIKKNTTYYNKINK